nr:RDD family protein [Nocardioides albus]
MPYPTASWGRRVLALFIDWFASSLVASVFLGARALPFGSLLAGVDPRPTDNLWILVVFVVQTAAFTSLGGGSFGKLVTRLRTVRVSPGAPDVRPPDPLRSIARQILVVLVVPPLVFRADRRGLHDLAAGTATVTLETYRHVFRRVG